MTTTEFASRFPKEVRESAKALSTDNDFAVLALLIQEGGLSFGQILENLEDLHQQSLANTLKRLQQGGFITRKEVIANSTKYSTEYRITDLGEDILEGFLNAFSPKSSQPNMVLDATGSNYHSSPNPYTVETNPKKIVSSGNIEEASQVGGLKGKTRTQERVAP